METEPPRAPPPSRYRSVRRKINVPAADSVPPPLPTAPLPRTEPIRANIPRRVDTVVRPQHAPHPTAQPAPSSDHEPLSRNKTTLRKMLRLNTSARDDASQTDAAPLTAPASQVHHSTKKLSKSKTAKTDEDDGEPRGLMKKVKALGAETHEKLSKGGKEDERAFDIKIPVAFTKGPAAQVPILNTTNTAALLDQVRPGHDRYLLECWPSLGLVREVRYFEFPSDVVNTWDAGNKCHFKVSKKVWRICDTKLEDMPKVERPSEEAFFYYYVTADKKWQKRTLRLENGVLRIVKKDRPQDKDYMQTITLENFDIYTFEDTFRPDRHLRSPTKYCFALKSQHKLSIFGKNSVFCHYFAVDTEDYYTHWFDLVREAKSRLIAEKKGLAWWAAKTGEQEDGGLSSMSSKELSPQGSPPRGRSQPKPLLSPEELAQPPLSMDMQRSKSLHRSKTTKQPARSGRSVSANAPEQRGLIGNLSEEVFSSGGLLGADYEEKKRLAQLSFKQERNRAQIPSVPKIPTGHRNDLPKEHQSPLGPDGRTIQRRETAPVSRPSTSHKQGGAGTLLNFHQEELAMAGPKHRRGRGHTVSEKDAHDRGGLVSFATAPRANDDVPAVPSSPMVRNNHGHSPLDDHNPFTGTGLLAREFQSAGAQRYGHGVAKGTDAVRRNGDIKPLMPNMQQSIYAPGSLLEKREREIGPTRPVIDRDLHTTDSDDG